MNRAKTAVLVAITATLAAWGCGGGGPPSVSGSDKEATVRGTVTIKGKPATTGEVTFDPANINRPNAKIQTSPIGKDGTYTVKTLVGENTVRLVGIADPRYNIVVDVKPGEDTVPIDVP
jgi:hypothetical protein